MAYEFKKLSDVEVVETVSDSANVLIEENGVIKKAPKTQVGGAGDTVGEADLIIRVNEIGQTLSASENIEIVEGSIENVYNKIRNHEIVDVRIRFLYDQNPWEGTTNEIKANVCIYADTLYIGCIYSVDWIHYDYIYKLYLAYEIDDTIPFDIKLYQVKCTNVT